MDTHIKEEFRKEFKALLEKYNVGIDFSVGEGSDTHGLYDEKTVIYHNIPKSSWSEDWFEFDGWGIDKTNFK